MSQIPSLTGIVQATANATADSLMKRDSSKDSYAARFRAETAVHTEGLRVGVAAKTANYTVTEADYFVPCDATSAAFTVTLPAAATSDGQVVVVRKTDTSVNAVTIDGNASETIDGDAAVYLHFQYESVTLVCDATGWHIVSRRLPDRTVAKSASFTVGGAGSIYLVTVGAGVITVTLPAAATMKDKPVTIKRVDAGVGSITLSTNGTETVDGTNDPTLVLDGAGTQYDVRILISDGSNWHYLADRGAAT